MGTNFYPTFEELSDWLDSQTASLGVKRKAQIDACFVRAGEYSLEWDIMHHAYENRNEPDFDIVEQLEEACFRWDI